MPAPTIAAAVTALLMLAVGAFWMVMWLIGANGYNTEQGVVILGGNALLALAGLLGAAWLARALTARWLRDGWPAWGAGALAIAVGIFAALLAMFIGAMALVVVVEAQR
ncbi:MAG: hypothetical protein ABIR94_01850 [Rubrivivax sp.]